MMFKGKFHPGIKDGSITRTYRYWKRPQAVAGNFYKINPIGHIRVTAAGPTTESRIRTAHAIASGFESRKALIEYISEHKTSEATLYCVEFVYEGRRRDKEPDQTSLADDDEFDKLAKALATRDKNSGMSWTHPTLALIGENRGASSAILAEQLGRDRAELKKDVRKLKSLGLTNSLEVGYELTDRARSYLRKRGHSQE